MPVRSCRCMWLTALTASAAFSADTHAQTLTAIPNFIPTVLSADGQVIGGLTGDYITTMGRWLRSTGTIESFPTPASHTRVMGISGNGTALVGNCAISNSTDVHAWCWTPDRGTVLLTIPNSLTSQATCISRDGRTIGGIAVTNGGLYHSFVLAQGEAARFIPEGGNYSTWLHALSPDGRGGIGSGSSTQGQMGTRWDSTYVWCANMGSLPGFNGYTLYAATPDLRTCVGEATPAVAAAPTRALLWTQGQGAQVIDTVFAGYTRHELTDISDDGQTAGGFALDNSGYTTIGLIWTPASSLVRANQFFAARGVALGTTIITRVVGVSANGRVFACATNTGGALIDLGPCNAADFNNDSAVGTDADIEAFFRCLGGSCCPMCDSADFNHDGDSGTDLDIEAFFRVLAGGHC